MRLLEEDKQRLRELFHSRTAECDKVPACFAPAKHRSTQIDTEKTLQGTSDTPAALAAVAPQHRACAGKLSSPTPARNSSSRKAAGRDRSKSPATAAADDTAAQLEVGACSIYESDFNLQACTRSTHLLTHSPARLAAARRTLEGSSEWADLDKLTTVQAQQEALARQQRLQQLQHQHRKHLDAQVDEHSRAKEAAAAAKAADLAAAMADVAMHAQEQAAQAAVAKQAAERVKQERQQQVVAAEAAAKRAAAKKAREDAALLAAVERQTAAGKAAAAAKAAAARQAAEEAKAANASALAAKKQAAKEQQRRDEELMQETIRTLQRQEEAREAALKAFHSNIAARAVQAGALAVAENKARQEREARLIAASEAQAQAKEEAKHAAELAKRAAQVEERKAAAAAAAAAKVAAQQAAMQEQARLRAAVQADLEEYHKSEELTAKQRRERNLAHRKFLEAQIVEAEERALLDDVFMAPKERELNRRLLSAARSALDRVGLC